MSTMSAMSNVNNVKYQHCQNSTMSNVKNVKCTQCQMSTMSNVNNVKCQQCQMSTMSNVNNVKCQQCQMSTIPNVNNVNNAQICRDLPRSIKVLWHQSDNVKKSTKLSKCQSNYQNVNQIVKLSQYQMSCVIRVCRLT